LRIDKFSKRAFAIRYKVQERREALEKIMSRLMPWFAAAVTVALPFLLPASAIMAQDANPELATVIKQYLATHPDEVRAIVKDYVVNHPELFRDTLVDLMNRQPAVSTGLDTSTKPTVAPDPSLAVKNNAVTLFGSTHQVTLGDPHGDVTMVEFFDYNCGYCKGALPAMLSLLGDDPKLKVVLKEWPILGPGSVDAAHVAIAVRMQDPDGRKYLAFHQKLLGDPGAANKEKALAAAAAAGLDIPRLEKDMDSNEVGATIDEDFALARAIGINGTPGYVIGNAVVAGAIGLDGLKSQIATARVHAN
jgi:protein-disulfide isomerase